MIALDLLYIPKTLTDIASLDMNWHYFYGEAESFVQSFCTQLLFMSMCCLRAVSALPRIFGLLCSPTSCPIPAIFNWRLYNGSAATIIELSERAVIDS